MKQRRCALVIGPDLDGAARTVEILARLGFTAFPAKSTGTEQSCPIADFNLQVLQSPSGERHEWHTPAMDWRSSAGANWHDNAAALLNDRFGNAASIVLHDRRMATLADLWLEVLAAGFDTAVFLPLCHPVQFGSETHGQTGPDPIQAQYQWLRTMLDAERTTRGHGRFLYHNAELLNDWRKTFARAPFPGRAIAPQTDDTTGRVIDRWIATVRATLSAAGGLEPLVAEAHGIFAGWADKQENPADYERLDSIAQDFVRFADAARPLAIAMSDALWRKERALAQSREELVQALDDIVSIGMLLRNEECRNAQLAERVTAERLAAKSSAALLEKAGSLRTTLAEERAKRKALLASMQERDTEFRLLHEKAEQLREHKQHTEAELETLREHKQQCETELAKLREHNQQTKAKLARLREHKEIADTKLRRLRETSQAEIARLEERLAKIVRRSTDADRAEADLHNLRVNHAVLEAQLTSVTTQREQLERQVMQATARTNTATTILQKMADERLAFPSSRPTSSLLGGNGQARWRSFCSGLAASGLFDADQYLAANPDVSAAQFDPLTHYLTRGLSEGRPVNRTADQ